MSSKIVTIRLSPTEVLAIEQLIRPGRYRSRCHLVREAIEALLLKERLSKDAFSAIRTERPRERKRSETLELSGQETNG